MNIMRKLRSGAVGSDSSGELSLESSSHTELGLMHLKKLFNEYTHPKEPLSETERDYKLYNMLPLFCKVFGSTNSSDMNEQFWDILAFAQQVSRLMVSEIRRRASNQSTEAASIAIVKFFEIENSEESSNGWMLLSALNLLAVGDASLIQVMTTASVPSTLVKCLYLFFDLPEIPEEEADRDDGSEFTQRERRILLQKIFVQVLVKLCSFPYPAEELAKMDDLTLLFSAITSQCPAHNVMWRKSAAEVLTTLSRHGLTGPVVDYIHSKGCMALCIDNMQRVPQLTPLEVVEMLVAVFCFLKDSSEVSQILLDDFRACQGYSFLADFIIKLDNDRQKNSEAQAAIRNLVLMIASLCMCGYTELRPNLNQSGSLFQMQGFTMPQTSSRGTCIRNVHAFQVLQTIFLKSNSTPLCCNILDAISSVYHSDNANYFILESQNTLCQFTEKIHVKSQEIQEKFFELLEFIVFQLNFVPCKELISMSILLKSNLSIDCSISCMKTLLNILKHNNVFKDAYREVGILEVFVTCLQRYETFLMKYIGEHGKSVEDEFREELEGNQSENLGRMIISALIILLNANNANANVFRESGGAKCVHDMVKFAHCREGILGVIRELILSAGGDDDMLFILSTMHSAPSNKIQLKIQILKILLGCLRDSHRTRTIFRKVGGFVYVTSVFVSLDGILGNVVQNRVEVGEEELRIEFSTLLQLLNIVCQTLATAMRFEPANAKFFHQEICSTSFCDTLRLLGCFGTKSQLESLTPAPKNLEEFQGYFHGVFVGNVLEPELKEDIPLSLILACLIYRLLYDISIDNFDKPNLSGVVGILAQSGQQKKVVAKAGDIRSSIQSLNLSQQPPEPLIVHPGVVMCMLQLLPSIECDGEVDASYSLQTYMAEVIKSLVRSERNQQIMCEAGLAGQLLKLGTNPLNDEQNLLHIPLQYILERLAAQALQPAELRAFLRLGDPLHCQSPDFRAAYKAGGSVPLTRIKTLVSMTTPRDFRAHGSCTLPPFIEMDMSSEGFASIFLPSIAPQAPNIGGNIDTNTIGGIGAGDRIFPPQSGLSYSTWFCVDKFSDPRTDPHCVRLLTLVRTVKNLWEDNLVCLTLLLSARDKAIIVSTQETIVPQNAGEWEPDGTGDSGARIWCPDLLHEGQWHHLVVVLNRAVLKNSSFSLFLDGQHMHTQKLHFISQNPGAGAPNLTVATSVYAFIGTPPAWRRYSRLCWKQGVCHLIEDVISPQMVVTIFNLGPHYMGSLQAPQVRKQMEPLGPLIPEERVMFGLNAKAISQLTLAKIRKVYSRADNKTIAKQLGMSSHENATPIRILHNSAGHLAGPARSLGGVLVGYLGVRVFSPHPVSAMIETVGGCSILLGIIGMAQDVESLYAGVKALTCVVRSNRATQSEMDRKRGYQTLGMFFKKKKNLLNSHILHLTFSLVGTVNSGQETSAIPNVTAFQDLLCDLEVWQGSPNGLLRSLLEHLVQLASESSEKRTNIKIMRDLQLVMKLLHIIFDIHDEPTTEILFSLLSILLGGQPRHADLLLFGQFIAARLPQESSDAERNVVLGEAQNSQKDNSTVRCLVVRNRCLGMLHGLLFTARNTVNTIICDDISKVLGMDWLLLFHQAHIHPSSVVWSMRILVVLCANETIIGRFRDGTHNGGYLRHTDIVSQNKSMTVLATSSPVNTSSMMQPGTVLPTQLAAEVKTGVLHVPGFQYLEWLLPQHLEIPELYFLLIALIMGQPVKSLASDHKNLDLDKVWTFLWGGTVTQASMGSIGPKVNLCPEAVCVLLAMVRRIVHTDTSLEWLKSHPVTIIQVLFSLYHNLPDFMPVVMSGDVINSLSGILFPEGKFEGESGPNSPTEEQLCGVMVMIPPTQESSLTKHPVRKFIIDFLRVIIVDSMSLSATGKASPVVDLVLDSSPESSDLTQQIEFQTEIISALMDHLLAADVLVGEQAALPIVPLLQSHIQNVVPNVFYVTARIVDKLWQGCLNKDPHEIFDFIVKLIGQAKRRSSSLSLEQLHHSLNRTILYLLSRSTDSVADQMAVLEALHKLTTNRLLIFGAGNHELDFIGCLTYCLLQLTSDMKILLEQNSAGRTTTWHVNPTNEMIESRDDFLNQHQGKNLIAGAAFRVWEELYVCKKPAIEEVFKVSLTPPANNAKAPDLTVTRDQIVEAATKLWFNYVESERKATYRVPWEFHNQIQSKIQKVTGGLTRLASRTKVKKEDYVRTKSQLTKSKAYQWTAINVGLVRDLWDIRYAQHNQMMQHIRRYVYQEWIQSETELTRERGLWGPVKGTTLEKWMLDSTEGPHRMRKKTMRNDMFYFHYPYRPELELPDNRQLKYKVATSFDSKFYSQYCQQSPKVLCEMDSLFEGQKLDNQLSTVEVPPVLERSQSEPGEDIDEEEEEVSHVSDNQTLLRMLEEQEKISHMFRCARIQGLDTTEGLLLFGKEHCYIVDGFTLLKNREIRDIDSIPVRAYDPILPNPGSPRRSQTIRQCSKFSYEDIREVHKRRYLLQPIALEVFSGDGRNYLLSFPRKVRNKVYQRFMSTATSIADSAQQSVAGQKRTASVEQTSGIFSSLIGETSVTQRWVRGEISNFQYLMHLNTLAGRSYNDLMQYPVFPWILADYESDEIDLSNPASFRDFSKPMGAQSGERLEQFQKRYKEWDDPQGETPPYHYGTHYSSAMIVCSYLVRLEPFTQHFLRLQGGHFDLADRMFHSVKEAWLSASKYNMADVKELIPEFFYLPEFLANANNFDLGTKQNGESLGDIVLPPWAKDDPREFIRMHRQALECDYVSQNLHQWIDLIFGYKQQGPAAVDAVNVFHHLFYEGNVDIYNIDDPLKKNATIGFINNFGQIPKQLFKKPHPSKKMTLSKHGVIDPNPLLPGTTILQSDKLFFHNLDNLKPSLQPIKELKGPVGQIIQPDKTVLAVEQNKVLMPPSYAKYIAWGFADHSLRIGIYESDRVLFVCETVAQNFGEILTCACPNARTIITAGTSSVVTVWEFDSRKKMLALKQSLHGHTDAITCLAASPAFNVIVSGSRDGTAIVWDMARYTFVRQLRDHVGVVAAVCVNELTGDIATCSATWLYIWSINGHALANVNTSIGSIDRMQQILCVAFSSKREWDQQNVIITGSTDGVVRMWSMEYVQIPIEEKEKKASVEAKSSKSQKEDTNIIKQISEECSGGIDKSPSESSLSEACDSVKETSKRFEAEKEDCSENDETPSLRDDDEPPIPPIRKKHSISAAKSLHEFREEDPELVVEHKNETQGKNGDSGEEQSRGIRPSKSETSITGSFVVIENDSAKKSTQNTLRSGFKWQRQLLFRSKLTMHTAYDRKDNTEPASITSLAVSKDHRTLYVGDARGRLFSWSVCEQPGRSMADHWLKDEGADQCINCSVRFTLYERKHHCRNCGQVFCNKCSRFESEISRLRILKPVRVCQKCYQSLKQSNETS
ncbi:WD repeat and FYVE domain-containing protein 3 [Phlebotomus papatasi]|nr:WD repeat and FYVE domain-containing protein 3 [Phlebotomus papatasi]